MLIWINRLLVKLEFRVHLGVGFWGAGWILARSPPVGCADLANFWANGSPSESPAGPPGVAPGRPPPGFQYLRRDFFSCNVRALVRAR